MRASEIGTPWSRAYRNAGGAFFEGCGVGAGGTSGRSSFTLELNLGGNDSNGASAELARHGRGAMMPPAFPEESTNGGLLLDDEREDFADGGTGAGGTGRVGLGGVRDDGAESRTGTDDEM